MLEKLAVFVSSTSELEDDHRRLVNALRADCIVYSYLDDPARPGSPEEICRHEIQRSEVFFGLLGCKYGSRFPQSDQSIVEWEYGEANKVRGIGIFMFVKEPPKRKRVEPTQQGFIDRVRAFRTGKFCRIYLSPDELINLAFRSIAKWVIERNVRVRPISKSVSWLAVIISAVLCALAMAACVLLGGLVAKSELVAFSAITLCGICSGAVVTRLCFWGFS